ncbi:MAG: hypothetical protein QF486_06425 [Candidatus Woesearchaeota archaeon]|nr:hypothetical protein [Candidatus Woesearchaeota archaeon]MDP7181907.1 hypothetical protein [Candidatus Woesearchaeota archaeon]MDP7199222.1 hypothetical protein [Candidatus Woesearchaeota archaeon]MDP7467835.1 hypothetical protein [Candidatus Woesearchaeota archaeon]MDP7647825.1 hypothetical protein [Candidatus Woesearchaeota archaeon]
MNVANISCMKGLSDLARSWKMSEQEYAAWKMSLRKAWLHWKTPENP